VCHDFNVDDGAYEWTSVVRSVGLGLEDLEDCVSGTISWLKERGIDPQSLGLDDIRFAIAETPRGLGIQASIRLKSLLADELPVVFEGSALGRRFTFKYGENLLHNASYLAVERPEGGWVNRGGGGGSLTGPDGRANGWSSVQDVEDGIRSLAVGTPPGYFASARLFRGESKEAEAFPFYQVGSRFDVLCGATLLDLDGVSLEYLDSMGNVLASTSFGRRG
jgi:hypothetical protein